MFSKLHSKITVKIIVLCLNPKRKGDKSFAIRLIFHCSKRDKGIEETTEKFKPSCGR